MTGASNYERQDAYILESTVGTTPATPAFTKLSFDTLNMTANARISEKYPAYASGQRGGIARNGIAVAGTGTGGLIYGAYDDFLASLFQANWSTDVLVNGYDQIAMTIEQAIPQGAGGTLAYTRFKGVEAVTGQIELTAGEDAKISLDLIGSGSDDATATMITGATYADPSNTDVLGSGSDIGTITMSGLTPLDCMRTLTIDFGVADKEEQLRISSDDACGITRGAMRPTLTGEFYVEDNFIAIYNAARAGTDFAMVVPIGSATGEKYEINFPSCEFAEAPLNISDSGPAFQTFTILPKYDSGIGGTCEITRAIT